LSNYSEELRNTVEQLADQLGQMREATVSRRPDSTHWSAKEILGHLIDSAANNHQRFVRAAAQDHLVFSGYAQDDWVAIQRYQDAPWTELVQLWLHYNLHLARLMIAIPHEVRFRQHSRHNFHQIGWRMVPEGQSTTLDYLMRDYVAHLQHHVSQIRRLLNLPSQSVGGAPGAGVSTAAPTLPPG
jgi:hypothetical protein